MTCHVCDNSRVVRTGTAHCPTLSCCAEHDRGEGQCPVCCACEFCGAVVSDKDLHREPFGDAEIRECVECFGERATVPEMRGAA